MNFEFTPSGRQNFHKILHYKQVVVITGASSGLGEALAHTFYMAGCKVILCARRQEELERVRKDLLECHPVCSLFIGFLNFLY